MTRTNQIRKWAIRCTILETTRNIWRDAKRLARHFNPRNWYYTYDSIIFDIEYEEYEARRQEARELALEVEFIKDFPEEIPF